MKTINGFDSLKKIFVNTNYNIVDFILKNTYFFDPEIVRKQTESLLDNNEPLFVRYSKEKDKKNNIVHKFYYKKEDNGEYTPLNKTNHDELYKDSTYLTTIEGSKKQKRVPKKGYLFYKSPDTDYINIAVDYDGNKKVREEIKNRTSRIVSEGERNNMINFVITHIWSNATHPYYFSFMWNYCLTPSFAASLTDKSTSNEDSHATATELQEKMRKIAKLLYGNQVIGVFNNKNIDLKPFEITVEYDVMDLNINIIKENGEINQKTVREAISNNVEKDTQ